MASNFPSRISPHKPGLNNPKKRPSPGWRALFGTYIHGYPSNKGVSQATATPNSGSTRDSAPCILQYATRNSRRGSCANFLKTGEEYCTTCEATTSRRWRASTDWGRLAGLSNVDGDAGASWSESPISANTSFSIASRLIYVFAVL